MPSYRIVTRAVYTTSIPQTIEADSLREALNQILAKWSEDGPEAWTVAFTIQRDGAETTVQEVAKEFRDMAAFMDLYAERGRDPHRYDTPALSVPSNQEQERDDH